MSAGLLLGFATGFPLGLATFALLDLWFDRDTSEETN